MKRILFILVVLSLISLTSCTSEYKVVSLNNYKDRIQVVTDNLKIEGYYLSGDQKSVQNNLHVTDVSYSQNNGYGSAMANDFITNQVYTFSNEKGDQAEFTMKYRQKYSTITDAYYLSSVELVGCKTSNLKDYNEICGENSVVRYMLENIPSDITVTEFDITKAYLLSGGLAIMASFLLSLL